MVGGTDRLDGAELKALFLPVVTPEARKLMYNRSDFVAAQLKHYGVEYDKKEYTGNGVLLLKKVLKAGKCDKVPDRITALQRDMYREWLETQSPEDLAAHPEFVMDKYFLDHEGKPGKTRTLGVVGFPLPSSSSYRVSQLDWKGSIDEDGLLGWAKEAVEAAAKGHAAAEAKEEEEERAEYDAERDARHKAFLAKSKKSPAPSPVGRYMVDCPKIESNWPDKATEMTLAIATTSIPGLYQANFDFGILEGVMMISADESLLGMFSDSDNHNYGEDNLNDDLPTGSKRKAGKSGGRAPKAAKTAAANIKSSTTKPTTFFLRSRSRETGEGEIDPTSSKGTLAFKPNYAVINGTADLQCVGSNVPFTARKVSRVLLKSQEGWEDFSWAVYEHERVSRWY